MDAQSALGAVAAAVVALAACRSDSAPQAPSTDDAAALVGLTQPVEPPLQPATAQEDLTLEARSNLEVLLRLSQVYYAGDPRDPSSVAHGAFPASAALTPAAIPCGAEQSPNPSWWHTPTWEALQFAVMGRHRYSYQYDSSSQGDLPTFTASAFGDIDCDGQMATFWLVGEAQPDGQVIAPNGVEASQPLE